MKSAYGRINPLTWMKSLRDEVRLRRVMVADFISSEACLGFHLNVVKISSAFADFITVGDFIFSAVLFTFHRFYGIIQLIDKLEFGGESECRLKNRVRSLIFGKY